MPGVEAFALCSEVSESQFNTATTNEVLSSGLVHRRMAAAGDLYQPSSLFNLSEYLDFQIGMLLLTCCE